MAGAHTDFVEPGPSINDNGSGSIDILEVAIQLAQYSTNNAIRFGWCSGEEEGLLGSEFYVANLPVEEQEKGADAAYRGCSYRPFFSSETLCS